MSGPKGISYAIQQEEARRRAAAKRRLEEAQKKLSFLRIDYAAAAAALEAAGGTPIVLKEPEVSTIGEIQEQIRIATAAIKRSNNEIKKKLDSLQRAEAKKVIGSILASMEISSTLDLTQSSGTKNNKTTISYQRAGEDPVIVARAEELLSRQIEPDPAIAEEISELLKGGRATVELALSDLSSRIAALNKAVEKQRLHEEAVREARRQAEIEAVGQASDREFVLEALHESLEELGYSVAGTTVENPESIVLSDPKHVGYGINTGVNQAEQQIMLKPVHISDRSTVPATIAFEEELCSKIPELAKEMAEKGIDITRVRSTPVGMVAAPKQAIIPLASQATRKSSKSSKSKNRQGKANRA